MANYAALVQDMRLYFDANQPAGNGWGIFFTAPVEAAALRRFDLVTIVASVSWINLVVCDLHDSDYATTHQGSDMRLLDDALAVFTQAGVPRSRINLVLGFSGRSYTLSDGSCSSLNCAATGVGVVGTCTGTISFKSYAGIMCHLYFNRYVKSGPHNPY